MVFIIYGEIYSYFSHSVNYLFQYIYDRLHLVIIWLFMVDLLKSNGSFVSGGVKILLCVILKFLSKISIKFSGCVIGNFSY